MAAGVPGAPGFTIPAGHKFACIALDGPLIAADLPASLQLRPHLWALKTQPFDIDDTWREWLGSTDHERYRHSSLYLVAIAASNVPEVLDAENEVLEKQAISLLYALNLLEAGRYGDAGGQVLKGARVGGNVQLRQHSFLPAHFAHEMLMQAEVSTALVQRAAIVGEALLALYHEDPLARLAAPPHPPLGQPASAPGTGAHVQDHVRLRRGFNALLRAFRAQSGNERLHRAVTALAAVVLPEMGQGRRQFRDRCGIIVGGSHDARQVLSEIYKLRNCEEHLNDWEPALTGAANPNLAASLRSVQAEILACALYVRLLENATLRAEFVSDASTRAYWARGDALLAADWQPRIEIREAPLRAAGRLL